MPVTPLEALQQLAYDIESLLGWSKIVIVLLVAVLVMQIVNTVSLRRIKRSIKISHKP